MEAAKKTIQEEIEEEIRSLATGIELLRLLGNPLPSEGIQRTKDKQTYKGYDTDGYISQFCTNRFNEVLGTEWGVVWEILNQEKGSTSKGKPCWEITVKIGIWVLRREDTRWHSGGHVSKTHFDALKGAVTNGFKKAAALWGVGRHAFEGALDDDNDPWPEWAAQNGPESQEEAKQANQEQGKQVGQGSANQSNKEQAKQSNPGQGKQAGQEQGKQAGQGQPPQPPKREDPQQPKNNNGNAHESSQQNGHTPPASPAGNGKEAGLRRRITAKLETIFGRSEEMINAWLMEKSGTSIKGLDTLGAAQLEQVLEAVDQKFESWKSGK
jgi:hypothetical protein